MTRPEQRKFIRELTRAVLKGTLSKFNTAPRIYTENWDGHELRVLLADAFEDSASMSLIRREPRTKRARDYRNAKIVAF